MGSIDIIRYDSDVVLLFAYFVCILFIFCYHVIVNKVIYYANACAARETAAYSFFSFLSFVLILYTLLFFNISAIFE